MLAQELLLIFSTFDINNENASSHIVGYAETAVGSITVFTNTNGTAGGENEVYNLTGVDGTDFAGQITNRVSFAFTAPAATALLTANDIFTDTTADHVSATKVAGWQLVSVLQPSLFLTLI